VIPDYCEAITAYRAFDVFENGLLAGSFRGEPWPPYEPFVARCGMVSPDGVGEHVRDRRLVQAPVYGCGCGIYALKAPEAALERAQMARRHSAMLFPHLKLPPGLMCLTDLKRPPGLAWGAVKIWGRIIEHESGYRAEFAYPSSLHCDDAELARRVAALYGVACDYTPVQDPEAECVRDKVSSPVFRFGDRLANDPLNFFGNDTLQLLFWVTLTILGFIAGFIRSHF
jgi:hypothetical protein